MRKCLFVALVFLILSGFNLPTTSAQFPIKVPKITKPKPRPSPTESAQPAPTGDTQPATQPQPDTRSTTTQTTAGTPVITWTRIQFRADTLTRYKGDYDVWS